MDGGFLEFKWDVWPAYEWRPWLDKDGILVADEGLASASAVKIAAERSEKTGPLLCPALDSGLPRTYHPMERKHATLFLTFARLEWRDRDAIQQFATTYGLLGLAGRDVQAGEPHLIWASEILHMRDAINLSRNRTSKRNVHKLTWLFERPHHLRSAEGRMVFDETVGSAQLRFEPRTLLAGMWLQMAMALARDKQFGDCKQCGKPFDVSTTETGSRTDREFCSDSCKTKDYRRRKRVARQLSEEGSSLSAIADQIKTKKATVRRWLAAATAGRK